MNQFEANLKRRMEEWMRVYNEGELYAPLPPHEITDGIPTRFGNDRWDLIVPHLGGAVANYTALDIGAHWGQFAFRLEDLGYKVTAVEKNPMHAEILRDLIQLHGVSIQVVEKDLVESHLMSFYDVILAMGVMHFFARSKKLSLAFVNALPKCDAMFIQGFREDEDSGPVKCQTMIDLVMERLELNYVDKLGDADGRPIYQLAKL